MSHSLIVPSFAFCCIFIQLFSLVQISPPKHPTTDCMTCTLCSRQLLRNSKKSFTLFWHMMIIIHPYLCPLLLLLYNFSFSLFFSVRWIVFLLGAICYQSQCTTNTFMALSASLYTIHPDIKSQTASLNCPHNLHASSLTNLLIIFHALFLTICSCRLKIEAVLYGSVLHFNQPWFSLSNMLYYFAF